MTNFSKVAQEVEELEEKEERSAGIDRFLYFNQVASLVVVGQLDADRHKVDDERNQVNT